MLVLPLNISNSSTVGSPFILSQETTTPSFTSLYSNEKLVGKVGLFKRFTSIGKYATDSCHTLEEYRAIVFNFKFIASPGL